MAVETAEETVLCFRSSIRLPRISLVTIRRKKSKYLGLVEDFLRDFILEHLWRTGLLQNLILPHRKKALEDILSNREANNELLPREQGSVEETGEALGCVSCVLEALESVRT